MEFYEFIGVFLILFLLVFFLLMFIFKVFLPFWGEREYLLLELNQATRIEDVKYWKRELRRLYIRYIPFIGKYLSRRYR